LLIQIDVEKKRWKMVQIIEKCLSSLDQEPGGSLCIKYRYRVQDNSLEELLKLTSGNAVIEYMSDHKLLTKNYAEILGIDFNRVHIITEHYPGGSA
jgi:hypothetical protein